MWLDVARLEFKGIPVTKTPPFVLDEITASGIMRNAPRKMSRMLKPSSLSTKWEREVRKPVTPTLEQSHPLVYGISSTRTQRQKAVSLLQVT